MERIDQDLAQVGSKLAPLLHHIRANLFSSELNVQALKQACGVRDNSVSTAFGRAVGLPPRPYIEARRLETAEGLLRETGLPIHQIGDLVGFSSEAVFYRAFRRWRGEGPRRYRLRAQADTERTAADGLRPEAVQRALYGKASVRETEALIQGLSAAREGAVTAQPVDRPSPAPAEPTSSDAETERDAEALWDELSVLDPAAQRRRVRSLDRLDVELAELLFVKSRTEGRQDRRIGVHIAQLAVDCLYPGGRALEGVDATELTTLRARAYGWLGNAHRLARDFVAADSAFEVANRLLPSDAPSDVRVEVLELEASLRHFECRPEEAVRLLEEAERWLGTAGGPQDVERIARIRIQRARSIFDLGREREAEQGLCGALALLMGNRNPLLELAAYELLAYIYVRIGRFEDAAVLLPAVLELGRRQQVSATNHVWMSGLVWQGLGDSEKAEAALVEARERFVRARDSLSAAIVMLDLAIVKLEVGDADEALRSCAESIPLFESYRQHKELMAAVGVLSRLVVDRLGSVELLREVRQRLEGVRQDPRVQRANDF